MDRHAQFIAIEGLEGAGKSTAIKTIQQILKDAGINQVLTTREPGGTPVAEKIRHLVKHHDEAGEKEELLPYTELLLMYASRLQLTEHVIKPALAREEWVISDRFELSTWAYQGGGRRIPDEAIAVISRHVLQGFAPDLTLYLDVPPLLGLDRASKRGELDRFESEKVAFFERVNEKYHWLAKHRPNIIVIDAAQPLEQVTEAICAALRKRYPKLFL